VLTKATLYRQFLSVSLLMVRHSSRVEDTAMPKTILIDFEGALESLTIAALN
jgi:hypothetical protein